MTNRQLIAYFKTMTDEELDKEVRVCGMTIPQIEEMKYRMESLEK